MHIAIDARFYGPKGKGLGRYVQKLIQYLEEIDGGSERRYTILLKRDNVDLYQPAKPNFRKMVADFAWYSLAEQTLFARFLARQQFDLVHFCHFNVPMLYRRPFVVTIHDLILIHYPTIRNTTLNKYLYGIKLFGYRRVIRSAAMRAKTIIAVSQYTKEDIEKNLGVLPDRVAVTHEGCDVQMNQSLPDRTAHVLQKYGIMKPYLLYVGNAYPHKNLDRLCQAFAILQTEHPKLQLVLVGGADYFYQRLQQEVRQRKIRQVLFPGYIPDEELHAIYQSAAVYVFASLYEGFGLPPLEALANGTPVASSNRTSMPEVLQDAAVYFDPENIESMVGAVQHLLVDQALRQRILVAGRSRIKAFQWKAMAEKTLAIYRQWS